MAEIDRGQTQLRRADFAAADRNLLLDCGARLTDEELERLVEWLTRVWGTNQDK